MDYVQIGDRVTVMADGAYRPARVVEVNYENRLQGLIETGPARVRSVRVWVEGDLQPEHSMRLPKDIRG